MKTITIDAKNQKDAKKKCLEQAGFLPDAIRRVDSGNDKTKAFMCFESARDAELWDRQK